MKIQLKAIYHDEENGKPKVEMDLLSRDERSVPFRLWLLPRYWPRLELSLIVRLKEAKVKMTENRGLFTVEARVEGVSEDYAEVLAARLAALGLTVWIKGGDANGG
jgi:hypothetical protein